MFLLEPLKDLYRCCEDPMSGGADLKAEAQKALDGWRPAVSAFALALQQKRKHMDEEEEEAGEAEEEDEDEKADEAKSGSDRSGASLSDDQSGSDDEAQRQQLAELRAGQAKQTARMEFQPILELLEEEAEEDFAEPAELIQVKRKQKKKKHVATSAMGMGEAIELVRKILKIMVEEHKDVELPSEVAKTLDTPEKTLRDAVAYAGDGILELREDEDGNQVFEKCIGQKIFEEIQDNDGEPLAVKDLGDTLDEDDATILEAVEDSGGVLEIEMKRKKEQVKIRDGAVDMLDRVEEGEDDEELKETEQRAIEFRRIQVQRKAEDFLRHYTKGQNLVKVVGNKRYHRRVYLDTGRKALVIQGARGPKMYLFEHMREIDLESKTTKEGRLETLVTIAVEKNGRVYKEIVLSFPDQHKGSTFVNCLSLFAMALRKTT